MGKTNSLRKAGTVASFFLSCLIPYISWDKTAFPQPNNEHLETEIKKKKDRMTYNCSKNTLFQYKSKKIHYRNYKIKMKEITEDLNK